MNSMTAGSSGEARATMSSGVVGRGRPTSVVSRSSTARSQSAEDIYNNAVKKRADLPMAQQPRNFKLVKTALLGVSALCVAAAFASLVLGSYVESRHGLKVPGMRDVPFDISTAAVFLGGFGISVSLTLAAIVHRNWYPVLLTYVFFSLMIAVTNFTIYSMMLPGPALALRRAASWRSMSPELHMRFFQQFNCCGYSNALVNSHPTCNLEAIGKGSTPPSTAAPALVAPLSAPAGAGTPPVATQRPGAAPVVGTPPSTPAPPAARSPAPPAARPPAAPPAGRRLVRRQQQPVVQAAAAPATPAAAPGAPTGAAPATAAAEPVIPQFTNPAPLVSDSKPSGLPSAPNFTPPLPDSGVDFCQKSVDPALDAGLASFRGYYVFGGLLSLVQVALLCAYWWLLGTWKRSRGVARW